MARLYDGKATVEVEMREYKDLTNHWGPDLSDDFFGNGGCKRDAEHEAWLADDVDDAISYAEDWELGLGDFAEDAEDPAFDPANRCAKVVSDSRWYEVEDED